MPRTVARVARVRGVVDAQVRAAALALECHVGRTSVVIGHYALLSCILGWMEVFRRVGPSPAYSSGAIAGYSTRLKAPLFSRVRWTLKMRTGRTHRPFVSRGPPCCLGCDAGAGVNGAYVAPAARSWEQACRGPGAGGRPWS